MRMRKKQTVSMMLTFAMITGCFAGTGITAGAGALESDVSSNEVVSSWGGEAERADTGTKVPIYHKIPPYQQKNLYTAPSVKIQALPVELNVTGKPGGETQPYTEPITFQIVDTTRQEVYQTVEAKDGRLPELTLADNHTYTIYSRDPEYKVVRDDGNTEGLLAKNAYIWVRNGKIYDIKENADYPYDYPVFGKIQLAKRESRDLEDDARVFMNIKIRYKNTEGGELRNVKMKLVSDVETLEVDSGNAAAIRAELLEDVNYVAVVESEQYGIEAFPLTPKDKSEYRSNKGKRGERYFYDHSDCHQVEEIYLVDKADAHKNDTAITSLSGNTTISGFKFNDMLAMERTLDTSVTELEGKKYNVFSIVTVNPHRWEICKLAAGNFSITKKVSQTQKVENVYYIDKDGNLQQIPFEQAEDTVSFAMDSMSIYPVVFEYDDNSTVDEPSVDEPPVINPPETDPPVTNPPADDKQTVTKPVAVKNISVSGISKKIAAGKKLKLTAKVTPSNAANKAVKWTSSNTKYASVNANGMVTTKKAGAGKTVKIIAAAKDGSRKQAVYQIRIMKHAVKKITLKANTTVKAGKKLTVKATVKTTGKDANKKLEWTSSPKKYATVNSKGKVTTKKAGKGKKVKITAKATDGSGKTKTATIKIK